MPRASRLLSLFLAITCSIDFVLLDIPNYVSRIWSTTAEFEGFAGAGFELIRDEKNVMNNNNNSRYTFGIEHAHTYPSIPPTSRINVGCVYLQNFQSIFTSYKKQERENCKHYRATGHKINPHNVTGLSEGKRVIKHHLKKAIAINQRKPSVSSDELGLDLSAISNPILEIRNCIQPPPLRT